MPERTCPVCGTSHQRQGIYCSRKCGRRVWNATARGSNVRPPVKSFHCEACGRECRPGHTVAAHASRFCGNVCKSNWHHERERRLPVHVARDNTAIANWRTHCATAQLEKALNLRPTKLTEQRYKRALRRDPCSYCGAPSTALDHIQPRNGNNDDWSNLTAACRNCNSLKGTLSLLHALPWIPIATTYHAMRRRIYAA